MFYLNNFLHLKSILIFPFFCRYSLLTDFIIYELKLYLKMCKKNQSFTKFFPLPQSYLTFQTTQLT